MVFQILLILIVAVAVPLQRCFGIFLYACVRMYQKPGLSPRARVHVCACLCVWMCAHACVCMCVRMPARVCVRVLRCNLTYDGPVDRWASHCAKPIV